MRTSRIAPLCIAFSLVACGASKPKQQQPERMTETGEGDRDMLEAHELEQDGETTSYDTDVEVELSEHETETHDDASGASATTGGAMKHTNRPGERETPPPTPADDD